MRWALLGDDDEAIQLALAARQEPDFTSLVAFDIRDAASLRHRLPGVELHDDWEQLLSGKIADAVIVGPAVDEERRAEQAVRLAQVGVPMLLVHPLLSTSMTLFQLDMIRAETRAVLMPWADYHGHPALDRLAEWLAGSPDEGEKAIASRRVDPGGRLQGAPEDGENSIEQIAFHRQMADRSRSAVLRAFARDVDLIRHVAGDITRLHAVAAGATSNHAAALASLSVSLVLRSGGLVRWSVGSAENEPSATLAVVAGQGRAVLEIPEGLGEWRLERATPDGSQQKSFPAWHGERDALARFRAALAGETVRPDWLDSARAVDLAETIHESLRRGRTIDLFNETYSEDASFKGVMGIAGCGLLLFGLFSVMVVAALQMVARQLEWRQAAVILGKWPYLLLIVFGIFLLLQLLRFLIPRSSRKNP